MGGGLRNRDCVERALLAGEERVVIGTKAVSDRTFIRELVEQHGERIAVGIDAKDGKVAVHGWVDTTDASSVDLAKAVADLGVAHDHLHRHCARWDAQGPEFRRPT
jgi:phosphoribosylformimino-5-aminoimidazole carboxamide ribotide isomerase